jgi:Na+/H+-dicarboxylate symporter
LRVLNFVKEYSMLILTVIAAAIAIVLSIIIINATDLATMSRKYEFIYLLGFPGLIFLRLLQLLVIPLIMVTIAHGSRTSSRFLQVHSSIEMLYY